MKPLDRQVVVITGASSGIGRATALRCARQGARVALIARRAEALDALAREIEDAGGQALALPADVSIEEEVERAAERTVARFGAIDTWVNDAGIYLQGRVDDVSIEEYRRVLEVNLVGYIIGSKCALRQMRKQGSGTIVLVSSIVGKRGAPFASAYSTAKAGIDGFAEALRAELWGTDIHVATIYPPSVDTPIYDNARAKFGTKPKPAPPVRDPDYVAGLVAHLAVWPEPNKFFGWFRYVYIGLQELSPSLADWFLHETSGFTRTDRPAGPDNLFAPSATPPVERVGLAKVGFQGFTLGEIVRVLPRASLLAATAIGVVGALLARRLARPSPRRGLARRIAELRA